MGGPDPRDARARRQPGARLDLQTHAARRRHLAVVTAFAVAIAMSGGRLHLARICLVGLPLVVLGPSCSVYTTATRPSSARRPRRGAQAGPGRHLVRFACLVGRGTARLRAAHPHRRPLAVDLLRRVPLRGAMFGAGSGSARGPSRALPVHRQRRLRTGESARALSNTAASRPRSSPTSTSTRSRPGRPTAFSQRQARTRYATWPPSSTCTARSSLLSDSEAGEMLDLVRTLKAVGIRVSVVPRLLAGDRLLGRLRRPPRRHLDGSAPLRPHALLGPGQARLRPARRHVRSAGRLAPDDRDRDRDQARLQRPRLLPPDAGRARRAPLRPLQVPHDGPRRRAAQAHARRPQRSPGGTLQDRRRIPRVTRVGGFLRKTASTSCPSCSTSCAAR